MTFSEYALDLLPFISFGKTEAEYFTELVGNFIKDDVMDSCKLLKRAPDTKYRYIKGTRNIQVKDAQFLYKHRDEKKFSDWLWDRIDDSDSYESVDAWLKKFIITNNDLATACADLLTSIILDIINSTPTTKAAQEAEIDLRLINDIQEKIKSLPRPANVPVPKVATQDEQIYIDELCLAYAEAEGMDSFSTDDLSSFPDYSEDLEDRRIDFYAAEAIRRSVLELKGSTLAGQFDVLKDETYSGVKDTVRRTHPNGYERMLAVMEQAVNAPVTNYLLSASPYWISGKIKKGICHHLVNDGKLTWTRRKKNNE